MKRVYRTESIRRAERAAKEHLSEDELIERAAAKLCEVAECVPFKRAVILAGGGNNGSDALSLAHLLYDRAYEVAVYAVGDKRNGFVCRRIAALEARGVDVVCPATADEVDINAEDLVVDGLLGIGCNREITGIMRDIVAKINDSRAYVIAVDVPSGLDSDTGRAHGIAVKAKDRKSVV